MALPWPPAAPRCRVCLDGHIPGLLINWCLGWRQRSNALSLSACFPCQSSVSSLPLSHRGRAGGFTESVMSWSCAKKVQRVSSPYWPAKRKDYVRQEVRSEEKLSSWKDCVSQDRCKWTFFYLLTRAAAVLHYRSNTNTSCLQSQANHCFTAEWAASVMGQLFAQAWH